MTQTKLARSIVAPWIAAVAILCTPALYAQTQPPAQPAPEAAVDQEAAPPPMATIQTPVPVPTAAGALTSDEQIVLFLNRFTYGPRPGDVERVRAQGLSKWLGDQMNPQRIDDSALERRLDDYPAMRLPVRRLLELYPNNATIRAEMAGRVSVPMGSGEKAIYDAQKDRYQAKKQGDKGGPDQGPDPLPAEPAAILAMEPGDRFKMMSKLSPAQFRTLRQGLPAEQRQNLFDGLEPKQVEVLAALQNPAGVVVSELLQTKILRDIFSERQLQEMMVDFWLNHFNVYIRKDQDAPYFITAFERDTIRPHALGHFENLLVAVAESPAMLTYLDNSSSSGPHSPSASPMQNIDRYRTAVVIKKTSIGLNENYARELMELHTVGVNGGYTQKDVTEVARVFTGWTIGKGADGGVATHAQFDASRHEPGDKMVLGVKIKQNGEREGMEVLHLLATSPETARFISTKLAVRFVSDTPPPAMLDRMTAKFLATQGDIRQVLLAMMTSPEFFTRETFRAKVKTPQDYVVSAVRASGANVSSAGALASVIADLGMPIFGMQTPNGYSMKADPWNSSASLISRMNFALALSSNRVAGVHTDWPAVLAPGHADTLPAMPPAAKEQLCDDRILHVPVSDRTRDAILAQITAGADQQQISLDQISRKGFGNRDALSAYQSGHTGTGGQLDPQTALAAGLIFGSPEFQRR